MENNYQFQLGDERILKTSDNHNLKTNACSSYSDIDGKCLGHKDKDCDCCASENYEGVFE